MTSWMEERPLKAEIGKAIANWLFEDIICRWGCITEIITDNGMWADSVSIRKDVLHSLWSLEPILYYL